MPLLKDGQLIRDTYEVERFLGEGAFAEVYRVNHKFLGRQAMKVFKQTCLDAGEVTRMLGEAILLSRLGHPNIVRVFDANVLETERGTCGFFTMEYVPGGTLDKFWRSFGSNRVPVETCVDLMKQICRGLSVAHKSNPPIIHRDIKPQNILVGYEADGLRARLSDFGLAREVNPLTLLATAAGTLAFKPPEVFSHAKSDSRAGDIFAIGATLYLLLTDELPFHIDGDLGWSQDTSKWETPAKPSDWNVDVNDSLDKIVMKCLDFKPSRRYQSASELLSALEAWKPGDRRDVAEALSSSSAAKTILGPATSLDEEAGRQMAREARKLAKEGLLGAAADKMEEAFNQCPSLRAKYADQVRLWRMGISM